MDKRFMFLLLVVVSVVIFAGCSHIARVGQSVENPYAVSGAIDQVHDIAASVSSVVGGVASTIPVTSPYANVLGWLGGCIASFIGGIILCRKKKK